MKFPAFATLLALLIFGTSQNSFAEFTVTVTQTGSGVEFNGTGSIDLTDLSTIGGIPAYGGGVDAENAAFAVGPTGAPSPTAYQFYGSVSGPSTFAVESPAGGFTTATTGSGDFIGLSGPNVLIIPNGYASKTVFSNTVFFNGLTLGNLDLTPGTFTWTWGSGENADSMSIVVLTPYQPDNRVGKKAARQVGDNVYNLSGRGQKINLNSQRNRLQSFHFTTENDGTNPDVIKSRASKGNRFLKISYTQTGKGNVTGAITSGRLSLALAPRESAKFKGKIKPSVKPGKKKRGNLKVTSTSQNSPSRADRIRILSTAKGK